MAMSTAKTVDAYLAEADPARRPCLEKLRAAARANLPGHLEEMMYGMPCYTVGGESRFSFASQKQYISLYGLRGSADALGLAAAGALDGKGCMRFRKPEQVDFELVERLLRHRGASGDAGC
ncbi:MAG: DUF1801 domain-containing protein [Caulobacteraceae bacterium]|nr:DUF1801 domain-containing protein [Caulobacteraceae bacterium]